MTGCCDPNGLGAIFDERRARSDAAGYRSRGPDADERRVVGFLVARGVGGLTVLEVGGGVGAIQLELLAAGAATAINVEASPGYETSALDLAAERGLSERVSRRVGDFATESASVGAADAVILQKVVCCYPNMPALVRPAAARARRWLVLTFPADRWWVRLGFGLASLAQRIARSRFRLFFHEPCEIRAIAEREGLSVVETHNGMLWQFLALERAPA